jgi:5'-nucleotidase
MKTTTGAAAHMSSMRTLTLPRPHTDAPIILWDLDGTAFDWSGALDAKLLELDPGYRLVPVEERTHYDYMFDNPHDREILDAAMNAEGLYEGLEPLPYAIEAMGEMADEGLDNWFCSKPYLTHQTCTSEKLASVARHFGTGMAAKTILTHDKTLVFGHLLFDDKPTVTGVAVPAWKQIYRGQPYNAPGTGAQDIPRITDWRNWREAVYPALEEMGFNLRKMAFS